MGHDLVVRDSNQRNHYPLPRKLREGLGTLARQMRFVRQVFLKQRSKFANSNHAGDISLRGFTVS